MIMQTMTARRYLSTGLRRILLVLAHAGIGAILSSCQAGLPLDYAVVSDYRECLSGGQFDSSDQPGMRVVSSLDELTEMAPSEVTDASIDTAVRVAQFCADADLRELFATDFEHAFLVIVWQGRVSSIGHGGVEVLGVTRLQGDIRVHIEFDLPKPNMAYGTLETRPYSVIRVAREGLEADVYRFLLDVGGEELAAIEYDLR